MIFYWIRTPQSTAKQASTVAKLKKAGYNTLYRARLLELCNQIVELYQECKYSKLAPKLKRLTYYPEILRSRAEDYIDRHLYGGRSLQFGYIEKAT